MSRRTDGFQDALRPAQCRAARALVRMSGQQLARAAGVSLATLRNFEREVHQPRPETLRALRVALERAGIVLLDEADGGIGAWLRPDAGAAYELSARRVEPPLSPDTHLR